ncbi:MAG TPA: AMP-binding protein [Xanthobacteraceae bacterium]
MLEGCVPWPPELAARYRQKGYWEDITLREMLDASVQRCGDKPALVFGERRISYRQLLLEIDRLAAHLHEAGLRPAERVVLQLPNMPEFVTTFFALVTIGVIPVLALPAHRHTEISHFVKHSGAVAYFVPGIVRDFDYRGLAEEVRRQLGPQLRSVFVAGTPLPGQLALQAGGAAIVSTAALRPDPAEVALMLLSGGTTGLPKLIPRTHNDYICNCKASGRVAGLDTTSVFLAVLPLAHNYTLASPGILATLAYGGTVVIAPGTSAEIVMALIERERVTHVAAAVPLVVKWLQARSAGEHDLSSLRVLINGGARLAPQLRRRVREQLGCQFQEDFGTGEGLLNMTRLDDPDELVLNSSGAPVCADDEIRVIDDLGKELADGEPGELVCRGPYTIRGYYKAPQANAAAFTDDGFYRMGDVVRKVGRYVYAVGRKKDLINRGGEKISAEEVENMVLGHPAVDNVCIVAMPDPVYGERACAFVIPKTGRSITLPQLTDFLMQQQIAKFKLPERLELIDRFPLSPAGKVLRRSLRARIEQQLAQECNQAAAQ